MKNRLELHEFIKPGLLVEAIDTNTIGQVPMKVGTRVVYNGSEYEAIEQDTGKQGWYWRIVSGLNKTGQDTLFFRYDHPIYSQERSNFRSSLKPLKQLDKTPNKDKQIILPYGVVDAKSAYEYSVKLRERQPDLEFLIAKDANIAVKYAMKFKFRFYKAEPEIEKDPLAAMYYATEVTKERWPSNIEAIIKTNPMCWNIYKTKFQIIE